MDKKYILLTAAKNEEDYIGETIASVLRQTVRPVAWFIMDDGSSDRTAEVVESFARHHPFIRLQSAGSRSGRNFGSKDTAIRAAYEMALRRLISISFAFMTRTLRRSGRIITNKFSVNTRTIRAWGLRADLFTSG